LALDGVPIGNLTLDRDSSVFLNNVSTVFGNFVPIHDVPPVGNILWPTVLVLKVVGVFPNIESYKPRLPS
jgi:hypothetical protein